VNQQSEFLMAIADAAIIKINDFQAKFLAKLAFAFAISKLEVPNLFEAIGNAATDTLMYFDVEAFAKISIAFAKAGIKASNLFNAIANAIQNKLKECSPQALADIAWAFATLRIEAHEVFCKIADIVQQKLKDFKPKDLINTSWSFACVGLLESDFFITLLTAAATQIAQQDDAFSDYDMAQIYMIFLYFKLKFPEKTFPLSHLHDSLQSAYQKIRKAHSSSFAHHKNNVSSALTRIGWAHVSDYLTPSEGIMIDMAQTDSKQAIEFQVPSQYIKDHSSMVESGSTFFKNRLLKGLGWTIVTLTCWEWENLENEDAQDDYLKQQILVSFSSS